jgi:hypothetical protein
VTRASELAAAREALDALAEAGSEVIVRVGDREVPVPATAIPGLQAILAGLANGHRVRVLRDDAEITVQEAADILNISHVQFVRLLAANALPVRTAGSADRVVLADVLAYKAERTAKREAAFRVLADEAQKHGLGY